MNILLTLFILSLLSITVMIGKKVTQIRKGAIVTEVDEEILFEIPYIEEVRAITERGVRKYGYMALVITIRAYFRSANLVKHTYKISKRKIKDAITKRMNREVEIDPESSKFLNTISEYKDKIQNIKHRIREEEKN